MLSGDPPDRHGMAILIERHRHRIRGGVLSCFDRGKRGLGGSDVGQALLVYPRDVRSFCWCLVMLVALPAGLSEPNASPQPAAPGAQRPKDVWRGLHWDMPINRASQTLSRQGLKVREHGPRKDPTSYLSTEVDGTPATVYFDESGRMNQITVIAGTLTQEAAAAAKERLTKRFGAVKDTSSRTELTWGSRLGAHGPWTKKPWTKLLVVRSPEDGWLAHEEYGRNEASGPVGAFDLTWGQTATDVGQHLRAAGYETRTTGMLPDPCKMPNPRRGANRMRASSSISRRGHDEGSADVHKKRGLVQIAFSARVASYADGLARAKPIQALRGPASEIEDATITTWGDTTSDVSLDVREKKPKGTLSAIENYSPSLSSRSCRMHP